MTNLVSNGNFQTGNFTDWSGSGTVTPSSSINIFFYASGGYSNLSYVELGPIFIMGLKSISQTINTVVGTQYILSYYLLNQGGNPYQHFDASLDGGTTSISGSVIDVSGGQTSINSGWIFYKFVFTASSSTNLTFKFLNDPSNFWLTGISITLYQTASLIKAQTVGPASIPLKQNHPNNRTMAVMGMPFKPDTMAQGNMFSMARAAYNKGVVPNVNSIGQGNTEQKNAQVKKWYGASASRTCSEHTNLRTIDATGKSSTNYINTQLMSFSGPDKTTVHNALVRCRGSGSVAPKKKGANKAST